LWIVVLSYNGLADTRKCLGTLEAAIRPGVVPLLVDNGSTDDTQQAVDKEFPWCRILRLESNAGPAGGNNRGIEHALAQGADWILLLNNDTTVRPELCERLLEAAAALPEYALLGPIINYMGDPELVMTDAVVFNGADYHGFFERREVPPTLQRPPRAVESDVVNGCCMMIAAVVFR
jgi:GT2 family glycosyltransferase